VAYRMVTLTVALSILATNVFLPQLSVLLGNAFDWQSGGCMAECYRNYGIHLKCAIVV